MSFSPPTSGIVTIDSGVMNAACGSVQIVLNVKSVAALTVSDYTMDVTNVGSIEVDYNYIKEVGNVSDFVINVPSFEFEMLDTIRETASPSDTVRFVEVLTQLDPVDLIVAKITVNSKSDYYYTTREQCEFSYKDRKVKVRLQHPLKYGAIGFGKTWDASTIAPREVQLEDVGEGSGNYFTDAIYGKDLIDLYLNTIGEATTFYYSSDMYISDYLDLPSLNDKNIFIPSTYLGTFGEATSIVKSMALTESAIIGNILGNSYYVPRFKKDTGVRASFDGGDFEEIKLDYSFRNVRRFNFNYSIGDDTLPVGGSAEPSLGTGTYQLINDFGAFDIDINFGNFPELIPAVYSLYNSGAPIYGFSPFLYTSFTSTVQNNVINSYKSIFKIYTTASAGITISGKVFGIDSILPYGYFTVTGGVHPLVDGRDFRPSYLKYNLKDDSIEFEAYSF